MQHSSFGHNKVHPVEWEDIVKVLEGRLKLIDDMGLSGHHNLLVARDHNISGAIVHSHPVDLFIKAMVARPLIFGHRKDLQNVIVTTNQNLVIKFVPYNLNWLSCHFKLAHFAHP